MRWSTIPIRKVAPPIPAKIKFDFNESIWHLSLDQIESETGLITGKKYAPLKDAGSSTFCFDTANVLYSKLRPYLNKVIIPDEPGIATTELIPLRPNTKIIHPKFLTYYLRSKSFVNQASHHVAGAKMPRVVMDWFWEHEIPLPCLIEQNRIVEILDEADRLRRLRREADTKATRILPALFLKIFGDPATNPRGWNTGTLGSFGAKVRYGLGQPPKESSTGLPLIRATNVNAGWITKKNMLFVDASAVPQTRNAFLDSEEVIVVRSGAYTGDVAQVTEEWKGAVIGYDLVITPPTGWTGEFIEQYLLTSFVQKGYFISQRTRAGQPHLNSSQLEATPMFSPHPITQSIFADKVRAIRKLCSKCDETSEKLDEFFYKLLERAFSGQLTAKWREAHIKELLAEMEQQARLLNLPLRKELELGL